MENTKTIDRIYASEYRPIANLVTYSPLPTADLPHVNPFIFLNHHGPQQYPPHNQGLPFGPHPHRGMETVTFILEGDILHQDSSGHRSVIERGGVQWMTAGRGLLHAEVSSPRFKQAGGPLEILQLWLNLPARHKMTAPFYEGRPEADIPVFEGEGFRVQVIAGNWQDVAGAFRPLHPVALATVFATSGARVAQAVPEGEVIFFYVVRGAVRVGTDTVGQRQLATFAPTGTQLAFSATQDAVVIVGHAPPLDEPIVAQGPFVMNTEQEIREAYRDYQLGKFGTWQPA